MVTEGVNEPARARWHDYFTKTLGEAEAAEIDAAVNAALAAEAAGEGSSAARSAGRAAAHQDRNDGTDTRPDGDGESAGWSWLFGDNPAGDRETDDDVARPRTRPAGGQSAETARPQPARDFQSRTQATPPPAPSGSARTVAAPSERQVAGVWSAHLAPRLFSPPARWGWRAAEVVEDEQPAVPGPLVKPTRPVWTEAPPPDTSAIRAERSQAVNGLVLRAALAGIVLVAFLAFEESISEQVAALGSDAEEVYPFVVGAGFLVLAVILLTSASAVMHATRRIRAFEQPYKAMRASERERHQQALLDWEQAVREFAAASQPLVPRSRAANEPLWFPVAPLGDPIRLDVLGGDPGRHGWASLLTTLGSAVLSSGQQITLLDLTGLDVGGGLLEVAAHAGVQSRRMNLRGTTQDPALLVDLAGRDDAPDRLADAFTKRDDRAEAAEERAFTATVLRQVMGSLEGPRTFARLAAAVNALRQTPSGSAISPGEVLALTEHVGDIGQGEWAQRRLRFLAAQLDLLTGCSPDSSEPTRFAASCPLSVITTPGRRDDTKELLDRVLVQLAQAAMTDGDVSGFLFVAGADHLGAHALRLLSDHAQHARVRLALMVDHMHGGIERSAGTGGAVCVMKMYNHHDANMAAEFIGRGHRFVLNQMTRQVGKAFTDTGGDSFSASTSHGSSSQQKKSGRRGDGVGVNESRGHAWTGTRGWSSADNLITGSTSSRVYEFVVEPQQIMGMPETAFILVDNSGSGRQVVMADANPGICLEPRVALAGS